MVAPAALAPAACEPHCPGRILRQGKESGTSNRATLCIAVGSTRPASGKGQPWLPGPDKPPLRQGCFLSNRGGPKTQKIARRRGPCEKVYRAERTRNRAARVLAPETFTSAVLADRRQTQRGERCARM
jgi:hypothetical protein